MVDITQKEDIKEIVDYAKNKHIEVIPEIEFPGHSQAAIAAYPQLSCTGKPIDVATEWGVLRYIVQGMTAFLHLWKMF